MRRNNFPTHIAFHHQICPKKRKKPLCLSNSSSSDGVVDENGNKTKYDKIEDSQGASIQSGIKRMRADVCKARKQNIHKSIENKTKDNEQATQKSIANSISSELCNKQLPYHCSNFTGMTRRKNPPDGWKKKHLLL